MNGIVHSGDTWSEQEGADEGVGAGVFETVGARDGSMPLWPRHLHRMRAAARRLGLPWRPPTDLEVRVRACLELHQHDVARVRLLRLGAGCTWSVHTRRRDQEGEPLRVELTDAPRPVGGADACKVWPRPWLAAARATARRRGAHDALMWRGDLVLEATAYNVFVLVGGELRTPPADGQVLTGIGRAALLRARLPAVEAPVSLSELHASELVLLVNSVYGPRLAAVAGQAAVRDHPLLVRARTAWRRVVGP
ncbi:MAG: aminotransferase class IV [Planctomycetota bacterium]